jgi:23S rRNA G2445 N2-methylase RlmL
MIADTLRVIGSPGTGKVMAAELVRLGQRRGVRPPAPRKLGTGILLYPWDPVLAHTAVWYQRTATRVLWDLYESRASRLEPLYEELRAGVAADERPWYPATGTISVTARNVGGFAAGERQVVGTVKNAILDGAAARGASLRVDPQDPDVSISVRMADEALTVSIDLAGASLSQRGYRTRRAEASLREHLAAVMIMLARHDARSQVLVDPMCGAGTIAIEAALMADARPLWAPPRRPALHRLPAFAGVKEASEPLFPGTRARILAGDRDRGAIGAARANVRAAGVGGEVELRCADFRDLDARGFAGDQPGLVLSNPPYGERLERRQLERLYADLGAWCAELRGWRAGFLVGNPDFERAFGPRPRSVKRLDNGPLQAFFYTYEF